MLPPDAAAKPSAGDSPSRQAHWPTILLLLVAATVIRFLYLDSKPFWFDECFSAEVARIRWSDFLHLLWWREANMALYYALLRIWLHFGQSPFFIRSLSVLIAGATVPVIYWLAGLLYNRRVALIAAALFAFNAYNVRYAQEARSYALFLLLATLSSGFLISFLRRPTRRNWRGYVTVSILAVYAHFYALLLVAAQWLALRSLGGRRQSATESSVRSARLRQAWIVIGLAVLPLLVFVAKTGAGPIRWITRPGFRDVLEFYEHLAGGNNWALLMIYAVACVAAVMPLGKQLFARGQSSEISWETCWETWRAQFLLIWLIFPVLLTVLLSLARPVFLGRYMIFCLPALLILAAAGLARLRQAWLLVAALSGILLLGSQGVFFVYGHDFDNERDASSAASDFILDHSQPGDAVVFHIAATRVAYEFFRSLRTGQNTASALVTEQLGPEIVFPHHGDGLDYRDFTGKPTVDLLHAAGVSHSRVWVMLMNNGPAENPDAATLMLTRALSESFPRVDRWQFTKVEVRLYSR
jgi:mannosyltransferase